MRPVLAAFEKRVLAAAGAEPPEVYLREGSIVVRHNGKEREVDFAPAKGASSSTPHFTKPLRRLA